MNNMREQHVERLREALEFIKVMRDKNITALDNEFQVWKEEVQQSFTILFGKDHGCTNRFRELDFWLIRSDCGGGIYWSRIDGGILTKDLSRAEEIISDALEKLLAR